MTPRPIVIATRGSALALAQAESVLRQCREAFPAQTFELRIFKTTGDKLLTASLANPDPSLPKGLFTKELEVALLNGDADLAVHSLKDLPTQLPEGLALGAVGKRADVRDVLLYRDAAHVKRAQAATVDWSPGQPQARGFAPRQSLTKFPGDLTVATSSTRRRAQLLALRPKWRVVEIRGNVATRLRKLAEQAELDATVLAAAGLARLDFRIKPSGHLAGEGVPPGLLATMLETEQMLPCVGQAALGIEVRRDDARIKPICERLDHRNSHQCVLAERALLRALGGGCQSPVGAHAEVLGHQIRLRAVTFAHGAPRHAEARRPVREAEALGERMAAELLNGSAPRT